MRKPRLLLVPILAALACAGCDDAGDSEPSPSDEDPGRCASAPNLVVLRLGDASLPTAGAAVSCAAAVWLAPLADDVQAGAQVYVRDFASGMQFRTTTPDSGGSPVDRWSPALHGQWLAYAQTDAVVVEHLGRFERTHLAPPPRPGGEVHIHYPWVVWEVESAATGVSVIYAASLRSGVIQQVTPAGLTAVEPSVDAGRLVYTAWPADSDGPGNGLQGQPQVELVQSLEEAAAQPLVIDPQGVGTRAPTLYQDLLFFVENGPSQPAVVAWTVSSGSVFDERSGEEVPSFDAIRPRAGLGAAIWSAASGGERRVILWRPGTGGTVSLGPTGTGATSLLPTLGEQVALMPMLADDGRVIEVRPLALMTGGGL